MFKHRKLILECKLSDGMVKSFDLSNSFFDCLSLSMEAGPANVESINFKEVDSDDNILWEKVFTVGSVPVNWAQDALRLMDKANDLINFCAVHMPDEKKYTEGAKAFWDVCEMLATESKRLKKESNP